jgi:hypothetical protein
MERFRTALLAAVAVIASVPATLPAQPMRSEDNRPRGVREDGTPRGNPARWQNAEPRPTPSPQARPAPPPGGRDGDSRRPPVERDRPPVPNGSPPVGRGPDGRPGQWAGAGNRPQPQPGQVRRDEDRGRDSRWSNNRRPDDARRGDADRARWGNDRRPDDRRWDNNNRGDDRRWDNAGRDNRRWDNDRRGNDRRWDNDRRDWNGRGYRSDWRNDRRYDWRSWRNAHSDRYRSRYYAPRGWNYGYRPFYRGAFLQSFFYAPSYWLADPWDYRLPPVYGPYRWVRYYGDVLLVNVDTGEVVDVIQGFFM